MGLFLKQTEQRTQLQEKIAADLANRTKQMGTARSKPEPGATMLEDSQEATGRSVFWVSVVAMVVVAIVIFILFVFNGG